MKKKIIIIIAAVLVVAAGAWGVVSVMKYFADKKKNEENARIFQEYVNGKLVVYAQENATDPNYEVIFLGDSLTDGCDINKYYGEYKASNRGISGDRSYGLLDRMQVSAYDTKPQVIVLLIGGNDILGGKSVESVCENYEKIITGIREHLPDTEIVWCSLTAMGDRWAKYNDTAALCNRNIQLLAQKYGCVFVDLFTPLYSGETGEIFREYTVEGVHFTDKGYQVVSSAIKQRLFEILGH